MKNIDLKKNEICICAYDFIVDSKIEKFTLKTFLEKIELPRTEFNKYFDNKDDLIFEVFSQKFAEYKNEVSQNVNKESDFLEKLFALANPCFVKDKKYIDLNNFVKEMLILYAQKNYDKFDEINKDYLKWINLVLENIFNDAIENKAIQEDSKKFIKMIIHATDGIYFKSILIQNFDLEDEICSFLASIEKIVRV